MIRFLHVLLLSSSLSSSSSAAATTDLGVRAPRFKGIAYRAVNDNATHNIQLLAWIDATSFVGHWSVHHEGTGVNRTAIKSWVPPKPLAPVIANLINSTSHMPAGMRGIKASMYNNESSALADNILPSDANCSGKWPDVNTFSGVWWEHGAAEVATLHDQVLGDGCRRGRARLLGSGRAGRLDNSWWIAKGLMTSVAGEMDRHSERQALPAAQAVAGAGFR